MTPSDEEHNDFQAGFFAREKNAWRALLLYIALLYATLTLTYDLYISVFNMLGETWVRRGLLTIFLGIGVALLAPLGKRLRRDPRRTLPLALIIGVLIYSMWDIDVPANQIHFLQYGPLTVLVVEALRFRIQDRQIYPCTALLVLLVGIGDELLQSFLPERRFDPHDVVLNVLAGVLTLGFLGFVWATSPKTSVSASGRKDSVIFRVI